MSATNWFTTSDPCWLGVHGRPPVDGLRVQVTADGPLAHTVRADIVTLGGTLVATATDADLVVGTLAELAPPPDLSVPGPEGFAVWTEAGTRVVAGADPRGMLYGFLALARLVRADLAGPGESHVETPSSALRMIDQWDNMTAHPVMGEVERGYAGGSVLYRDGVITADRARIRDYARLLASVGINAVCVNNPNVHAVETDLITTRLDVVADLAEIFGAYGLACYVAVNFAAPRTATPVDGIAGCATADPTDPRVGAWWSAVADRIFARIPGFGGFLVKADSEGEPGPFAYGRSHADGANVLARAVAPHGGRVLWRCFVYNHRQDWRDRDTDRAKAAYDHFAPLDGHFDDNVALQVKFGPLDFQVREPVSPLIGALRDTPVLVEFQITQEYTGQQRHVYYLASQWREILDTVIRDDGTTVADVVTAGAGVAAVSNVGDSPWWTGHPLAQANLYAYGRLAWDTAGDPRQLAEEWIDATYGQFPARAWLADVLLRSRAVYEGYTAPLGVGFMVTPGSHYGPSVDGYEYSPWGTYHFADRDGIGVDRTVATGTGYIGQYPPLLADRYEDLATCPDAELLFFHHVRYDHQLRSGRTVVQHIYDTHIDAVSTVEDWCAQWPEQSAGLPQAIRAEVSTRLAEQVRSAREWRDQVCTYFLRHSGIPDAADRPIYP